MNYLQSRNILEIGVEDQRIVDWAVWGRKLSSTVLGKGTAYSNRGEQAILQGDSEIAEAWFDQAA